MTDDTWEDLEGDEYVVRYPENFYDNDVAYDESDMDDNVDDEGEIRDYIDGYDDEEFGDYSY